MERYMFSTDFEPVGQGMNGFVNGGKRYQFRFPNGFGASVITGGYGLFQVAVLEYASPDSDDWRITYNTGLTNDVIPCDSAAEVGELLEKINALGVAPESGTLVLKDGYRISATPNGDLVPEHEGVMVDVTMERRGYVTFPDGESPDLVVWVKVYGILSEVNDPDDAEELQAVMEYNFPEAFRRQ